MFVVPPVRHAVDDSFEHLRTLSADPLHGVLQSVLGIDGAHPRAPTWPCRAPELIGKGGWLNTRGKELTLADLRGHIAVLDF
ncbi:hypothetical protein AB0O22_00380 [Streptomyces sp. NPDC091204]|uniref:hypothetical protein n=1 Tax=Streptomyces sp. NPDC091204 TaxID=3155299 RepID=UPI00343279C3